MWENIDDRENIDVLNIDDVHHFKKHDVVKVDRSASLVKENLAMLYRFRWILKLISQLNPIDQLN